MATITHPAVQLPAPPMSPIRGELLSLVIAIKDHYHATFTREPEAVRQMFLCVRDALDSWDDAYMHKMYFFLSVVAEDCNLLADERVRAVAMSAEERTQVEHELGV